MLRMFLTLVSILTLSATASAAPIAGEFNIAGSLRATSNAIDFLNPSGGETGGFVTLEAGTGYFDGIVSTSLSSPYTGVAKDVIGNPTNVNDFLSSFSAPGYAGLSMDLGNIVAPTAVACTGSEAVNSSCSLGRFTLTNLGNASTSLAFVVRGSVEDSAVSDSLNQATGRYTTQTGHSISDVMAAFAGNGLTVSYSANFETAQVAEPSSLMLLGIALAASSAMRRSRRSARRG